MKNPRDVEHLKDNTYHIPTYRVTDNGIVDGDGMAMQLCQGNKDSDTPDRIEGAFTESILEVARQYLTRVNVGDMATRETSMAITKIDEALMWIDKRRQDRDARGVQGTYRK